MSEARGMSALDQFEKTKIYPKVFRPKKPQAGIC